MDLSAIFALLTFITDIGTMDKTFLEKLADFWNRRKYLIVLVMFLIVVLVASDNSYVRQIALKREIRDLQHQIDKVRREKEKNEAVLEELSNDSLIIERLAREKFGMHRADEDVFVEERK